MNVEYDNFVIARPGHNEKYNRDVTWEELKRTFLLYKRIPMIVAGGDHYGPIDPNHAIGFVDAKLDDDAQIVRGEPIFFKETFEHVPAEVQQALMHKRHVPASLGYEEFENGMRKVDHIAIGVKSPVFPDVGFNAESRFRYEETDGMNKEQPKATPVEPAKAVQFVTREDFEKFSAKVFEILNERKTAPPETPRTEEVKEEQKKETVAPPAEAPKTPRQAPVVEPERIIPRTPSTPSSNDGWLEDENGRRYLSFPVAGQEFIKKNNNKGETRT
jgi:hypothetical protein